MDNELDQMYNEFHEEQIAHARKRALAEKEIRHHVMSFVPDSMWEKFGKDLIETMSTEEIIRIATMVYMWSPK